MVMKDDKIIDKKEWKIKHTTYHVTKEALDINKIDINEFDKEAMNKEKVGREIIEFLSKYCSNEQKGMFVGQNTIFDKNFLEVFLGSLENKSRIENYYKIITHRYIDIMSITAFLNMANLIDTDGLGLDRVINYFNLDVQARHTALDDARLTFEGLQKMIQLVKPISTKL